MNRMTFGIKIKEKEKNREPERGGIGAQVRPAHNSAMPKLLYTKVGCIIAFQASKTRSTGNNSAILLAVTSA